MTALIDRLLVQEGLTYEQVKELAHHKDPAIRRSLAQRDDIPPEILYFLAADTDPEVRVIVANNDAAPKQADLLLAQDANGKVRQNLARKIARLAPNLSEDELNRAQHATYQVLEALARDQVPKVRQLIAEALKDVAHAPPDVIGRLARDSEVIVAAPVLEFSPVLTDDDLLEIIGASPVSGILSAISRRAEVPELVSDAIAATRDVDAIAFLLANEPAQIREEPLDAIIALAPPQTKWHAPLVRRPKLHAGAAVRMAQFVANNLLFALKSREDLEPDVMEQVASVVARRIKQSSAEEVVSREALLNTYRNMKDMQGEEYSEELLEDELTNGRFIMVLAGLAMRTKLSPLIVERVLACRDPDDIMALAGLSGMSTAFGEKLQTSLGRIPKSGVCKATASGAYPMSAEEMSWRISCYVSRLGKM